MPVSALPLQIGVGVSIAIYFTFSQSFFYSYNFSFSVHLQIFLSNELSENLDYSTTFSFLVSVRVSNLLFIIGLFRCFFGHPIRFNEVFGSHFLGFVIDGDVKPLGGISFIFQGFRFHLRLMGQADPFYPLFFSCRMARGYDEVSSS